jgi:hypothetical protein
MFVYSDALAKHSAKSIEDACYAFQVYLPGAPPQQIAAATHSTTFPISWPDTTCGYGGLGGASFTQAPCTVVYLTVSDKESYARVYHSRGFAYELRNPSPEFLALLGPLPGTRPLGVTDIETLKILGEDVTCYDTKNYNPRRKKQQQLAEEERVMEIITGEEND